MKTELHPLMQQHLKAFEQRDTTIINIMSSVEDFTELHSALREARKQNLEFAINEARVLIDLLKHNLEKNIKKYILAGTEL